MAGNNTGAKLILVYTIYVCHAKKTHIEALLAGKARGLCSSVAVLSTLGSDIPSLTARLAYYRI